MKKRKGNMFNSEYGVVGHGVNLQGVMGAGVAKEFKERFPQSFMSYRSACASDGDFGLAHAHYYKEGGIHTFNICTQKLPGAEAEYHLVLGGLCDTAYKMNKLGLTTIAVPMIGCGIGGLSWDRVEKIMIAVEAVYDIEFEVWKYDG